MKKNMELNAKSIKRVLSLFVLASAISACNNNKDNATSPLPLQPVAPPLNGAPINNSSNPTATGTTAILTCEAAENSTRTRGEFFKFTNRFTRTAGPTSTTVDLRQSTRGKLKWSSLGFTNKTGLRKDADSAQYEYFVNYKASSNEQDLVLKYKYRGREIEVASPAQDPVSILFQDGNNDNENFKNSSASCFTTRKEIRPSRDGVLICKGSVAKGPSKSEFEKEIDFAANTPEREELSLGGKITGLPEFYLEIVPANIPSYGKVSASPSLIVEMREGDEKIGSVKSALGKNMRLLVKEWGEIDRDPQKDDVPKYWVDMSCEVRNK